MPNFAVIETAGKKIFLGYTNSWKENPGKRIETYNHSIPENFKIPFPQFWKPNKA